MTDRNKVINGLEHCKIGDCVGCPYDQIREESLHGKHDKWELVCNEQLTEDIIALLKEQEGYVSIPFSWLVKFCTYIDFNEPMWDADREKLWKQKLKQQFDIDIPLKERNDYLTK